MTEEKGQWKWGVILVVLLAVFILVVDTTMMNVAINNLVQDLNTTLSAVQAIISLFALIMASFMLLGAKVGEIIGRKRAFIIGVVIYTAGTLTAAFAVNAMMLLVGWAILEGIAAAMMLPSTTTFITNSYTGKDRAMGFALWGGIAAAGAAFGPILGGIFTTYGSWRYGFAMEAGICMLILATSFYLVETKPTMKWRDLDVVGTIMSIGAMMLIVLAFLNMSTYGFINPRLPFVVNGVEVAPLGISIVFWVMLAGLLLFAAFIWWQLRRIAKGKVPLFNPQVLRNWGFNVGILQGVIQNLALAGVLFIFPVYLGNVHGFKAIDIGIMMMPMSLAVLVFSMGSTKLADHVRPIWMVATGLIIMIVGNNIIKRAFDGVDDPWDLVPGMVVLGLGMGVILSQLTNATMGIVKPELVPDASGLLNSTKQLGTSLGTAFVGGVLMLSAFTGMVDLLAEEPEFEGYEHEEVAIWLADFLERMKNGEIEGNWTPEQEENLTRIVDEASANSMVSALDAMNMTFVLGIAILLIGAVLYSRQLKRQEESLLQGDIDWADPEAGEVTEGPDEGREDEGPPDQHVDAPTGDADPTDDGPEDSVGDQLSNR